MTETDLIPLVQELTTVQEQMERLAGEEALIKNRIRALLPDPDSYAAGDTTVVIQQNQRFDQRKAQEVIPEDLLPLVTTEKTVQTIDRKKVEVLAPDYLDACISHYDNKIVLR